MSKKEKKEYFKKVKNWMRNQNLSMFFDNGKLDMRYANIQTLVSEATNELGYFDESILNSELEDLLFDIASEIMESYIKVNA